MDLITKIIILEEKNEKNEFLEELINIIPKNVKKISINLDNFIKNEKNEP